MGNQSRPIPSQLLLSLFAMDQSQVEQFVNAAITKNNETLLGSMKSILDSSLSDIKRANTDTADSHLREIKKLKFEEPRRFKKKANEDQFRLNSKLTDEAKSSCSTQNLDKVKESLEKGEIFRTSCCFFKGHILLFVLFIVARRTWNVVLFSSGRKLTLFAFDCSN